MAIYPSSFSQSIHSTAVYKPYYSISYSTDKHGVFQENKRGVAKSEKIAQAPALPTI